MAATEFVQLCVNLCVCSRVYGGVFSCQGACVPMCVPPRCDPAVQRGFGCKVTPAPPSRAHLVCDAGAGAWVVLQVIPAATIPILDDQVDGHLSLEAGDVAVTEVVAQVVDLRGYRGTGGATRGPGLGCTGTGVAFCSNSGGERA